ncbi:MAG: 16S rRNA (cytosine(1402)-N(4))-methyltransferase [Kordiimonas sp.]|nr:16S rRNA (cytosine(1402)-N(4))-methyltransferase [Kordiimonas sp.]
MAETLPPVPHYSVLLDDVLDALAPAEGEVYVDGTFGAGGYSRAVLDAVPCQVYGIDRDPTVAPYAAALKQSYGDRFRLLEGRFSEMADLLSGCGVAQVDGIMLDIGVSSMQLDQRMRGFSFQEDGPLDMRMSIQGQSAADVVNHMEEAALADILYLYGEEKKSRRIAKAIVKARDEAALTTTGQLAKLIVNTIGEGPRHKKTIHPATRTFQALRIYVNDELGELRHALSSSLTLLKPGGRLVVVTFHSLEDRIVKRFLLEQSGRAVTTSRHMPMPDGAEQDPAFEVMTRKAVVASAEEINENPRSRSAKLRAARRTAAVPVVVKAGGRQ